MNLYDWFNATINMIMFDKIYELLDYSFITKVYAAEGRSNFV